MDTITHALSGALLAIAMAPPGRRRSAAMQGKVSDRSSGALGQRERIITGAAAAAFPDIDFALRAIDTLTYLNWHQGVTHSLILLPLWALILAWLFALFSRQRYRWTAFYGIAASGLAIHIGGDLITAYGTQLLAPLSDARFSWPLLFVIDPIVTAILIIGLLVARRWPARQVAPVTFLVLSGYLGLQVVLQLRAIDVGTNHAREQNINQDSIHALPQPLSPFHWLIIVQHGDNHEEARVNLVGSRLNKIPTTAGFFARFVASFQPAAIAAWTRHTLYGVHPEETRLAHSAFHHPAFAEFRRFARFPVLDHVDTRNDRTCVWYSDLRFGIPGLPPSFRFGMCRSKAGRDWQLLRWRGSFYID